ncbi:hypothetical protein ACQKCH_10610 [Nubsella zeaxanthinifaciens]|uniref:hypothetical protein n=1 Tax=Nubsella zeaxanthinifaciens TaxID=392412 RepID=UPI003CFCACF0
MESGCSSITKADALLIDRIRESLKLKAALVFTCMLPNKYEGFFKFFPLIFQSNSCCGFWALSVEKENDKIREKSNFKSEALDRAGLEVVI